MYAINCTPDIAEFAMKIKFSMGNRIFVSQPEIFSITTDFRVLYLWNNLVQTDVFFWYSKYIDGILLPNYGNIPNTVKINLLIGVGRRDLSEGETFAKNRKIISNLNYIISIWVLSFNKTEPLVYGVRKRGTANSLY